MAKDIVSVPAVVPASTPSSPSFTSSSSATSAISSGGTTQPFREVTLADPGTNATETLTVSIAGGTLSGTGFTSEGTGSYVATGSVAQINADLAAATFTDTFATSSDAYSKSDYITLRDTGSANGVSSTASAFLSGVVNVNPQYVSEPAPSFTSTQPTVTLVSGQTTNPLADVTLSDPPPSGFVPSETLTAVVSGGTFSGTGFTHTTAGTYVATGTAAQINADLAAASFTDTRTSGTATDTISLSDTATIAATSGASVHPALTTVTVDVMQPVPSSPKFTPSSLVFSSVASGSTIAPFSGATLSDPGSGAVESVTVVAQSGTFSGAGFTQTAAGTYVASGTVAQVNADLAGARFSDTAYSTVIHGIKGDPITVTDIGSVGGVVSATATLAVEVDFMTVQPTPSSPRFSPSGVITEIASGGSGDPFSGVILSDPGSDATETFTAVFAGGTLTGAGFTQAGVGTYVATGSVAQVNADLAGASFTDTALSTMPGHVQFEPVPFTGYDTGSVDGIASATATLAGTVNVDYDFVSPSSPLLSPASTSVSVTSGQSVHALAGVVLSDAGYQAAETLTAVVSGGTLSGSGFTLASAGTYVATGSVAQINADLAAASFTDTLSGLAPASDTITLLDSGSVLGLAGPSAGATVGVSVVAAPVTQLAAVYSRDPAQGTDFSGQASFDPLAGVTVTDPTQGAEEVAELNLSGATGTLSGPGLQVTPTGFGYSTYALSGSPAQVNAELATLSFAPSSGTAGTLTVGIFNLSTYVGSLEPVMRESFAFSDTYAAPCYATGTRILTGRGEVAVEALVVGDVVVTASGGRRPIRWLGHRRVDCVRHPDPASVRPIRVRAHAFGPGLPARDLVLSPEHALFLDGHLVPVHALIDGVSLVQEAWERVTYHHVELDRHDVLLAEGLAAESYLDTGNRGQFANAPVVTLQPDFGQGDVPVEPCAPLALAGLVVELQRARLRAVAAGQSQVAA